MWQKLPPGIYPSGAEMVSAWFTFNAIGDKVLSSSYLTSKCPLLTPHLLMFPVKCDKHASSFCCFRKELYDSHRGEHFQLEVLVRYSILCLIPKEPHCRPYFCFILSGLIVAETKNILILGVQLPKNAV